MAARKIQDKEKAILEAAITVFAERGFWNTPTSLISKTAGVAEGTLFNYFATKDDLIQQVYLETKREMAAYLLDGLPATSTTYERVRHIWNRNIEWGLQHPAKFKVVHQINESFPLTDAIRAQATEPFAFLKELAQASITQGEIQAYPTAYLAAVMDTLSIMTIQFIATSGDETYKAIGFEILWNGVTR